MTDPRHDPIHFRELDDEVIKLTLQGWSVDYRVPDQAVVSYRHVGPLWLHLILLIVTLGIWFIVAVLLWLFVKPERARVWIAEDGRILQREAGVDLRER